MAFQRLTEKLHRPDDIWITVSKVPFIHPSKDMFKSTIIDYYNDNRNELINNELLSNIYEFLTRSKRKSFNKFIKKYITYCYPNNINELVKLIKEKGDNYQINGYNANSEIVAIICENHKLFIKIMQRELYKYLYDDKSYEDTYNSIYTQLKKLDR
jgi:hypothetical protein